MCYTMSISDYGQNLKTLRRQRGMSQEELAERLGVSTNYIGMIETGRRKGENLVYKIAEVFNVDVDVLLGDKPIPDNSRISLKHSLLEALRNYDFLEVLEIPIIGSVPAGEPFPVDQTAVDEYLEVPRNVLTGKSVDNLFALHVSGNSLNGDDIYSGDSVIVDRSDTDIVNGKIYIVRIGNDTCARHVIKSNGFLRLFSSNDEYKEIEATECEILGRVILSLRSKTH